MANNNLKEFIENLRGQPSAIRNDFEQIQIAFARYLAIGSSSGLHGAILDLSSTWGAMAKRINEGFSQSKDAAISIGKNSGDLNNIVDLLSNTSVSLEDRKQVLSPYKGRINNESDGLGNGASAFAQTLSRMADFLPRWKNVISQYGGETAAKQMANEIGYNQTVLNRISEKSGSVANALAVARGDAQYCAERCEYALGTESNVLFVARVRTLAQSYVQLGADLASYPAIVDT